MLSVVGKTGGNQNREIGEQHLTIGVVIQAVSRVNSKPQTSWLSGDNGKEREEARPVS